MIDPTHLQAFAFTHDQPVELLLPGVTRVQTARVLDVLDDEVLVRLQDAQVIAPPDDLRLCFGHKRWYYRVKVPLKAYYGPCWFLGLPNPGKAEKLQRRRFVRIRFSETLYAFACSPTGEATGRPLALTLDNISASGCLAIPEQDNVPEYLMLLLAFPGLMSVSLLARVIYRTRRKDGRHAIGINFEGIPAGLQDEFARAISEEIRVHLQRGQDITV
ncbi:MAG: PilZ domain-containing protein [Candidatus Sericytochromatia bacterium]|nr:PilZ domain-containing protein [Candidatus Sericytochromatia bacterium]